jgi:exopolysaccharide production protein ExoZ
MSLDNPTPETPPRRVLESIQHLRGLAAAIVVLHHSAEDYPMSLISQLDFGQSGVATFFTISGFIIWTSSRRETVSQFVKRRLIRIIPMYWLAIAVVLALGIHSWGKPVFAPAAIVKTLMFIPYFAEPTSHMPLPILVPGWTLNLEMLFYFVFAVGMLFRRPFILTAAVMGSLFILGQFYNFSSALLELYTGWISILFVAGLCIGARAPINRIAAGLWPLGALMVIGFNLLPAPQIVLACGIVLLIVGMTSRERLRGWPQIPALKKLGDASYVIYLFHMPVIFVLNYLLIRYHSTFSYWPMFGAITLAISLITGLLLHQYIEKPLGKWLRRAVEGTPPYSLPVDQRQPG